MLERYVLIFQCSPHVLWGFFVVIVLLCFFFSFVFCVFELLPGYEAQVSHDLQSSCLSVLNTRTIDSASCLILKIRFAQMYMILNLRAKIGTSQSQ